MTQHITSNQKQLDRTMKPEQFSQVVEAIASGRYSWACVLILRFAGYNPLHYIPYRTYSRLLKEHRQYTTNNQKQVSSCLNNISDLTDLEPIDNQTLTPKGGNNYISQNVECVGLRKNFNVVIKLSWFN